MWGFLKGLSFFGMEDILDGFCGEIFGRHFFGWFLIHEMFFSGLVFGKRFF